LTPNQSNVGTTHFSLKSQHSGQNHESELEWKLLGRDIGHRQKGIAVTFIVHASRGEDATTTIRLSVVVAIAKGRSLAEEGWQVFITGPDGNRYYPSEFDKLLSFSPVPPGSS
jgi:hypothetical protein